MPLLAQITDSHLRADEPERVLKLRAGVDRILALGVAPDAVLVTGDIADDGGASEYADAARELARLDVPLVVLPGNHDDRAGMRAAFGLPGAGEERLQSVSVYGGVRILACDTLVPGSDGGVLDVAWVADRSPRIGRRPRWWRCTTRPTSSASSRWMGWRRRPTSAPSWRGCWRRRRTWSGSLRATCT